MGQCLGSPYPSAEMQNAKYGARHVALEALLHVTPVLVLFTRPPQPISRWRGQWSLKCKEEITEVRADSRDRHRLAPVVFTPLCSSA